MTNKVSALGLVKEESLLYSDFDFEPGFPHIYIEERGFSIEEKDFCGEGVRDSVQPPEGRLMGQVQKDSFRGKAVRRRPDRYH